MGSWLSNFGAQLGALPPARQLMLALTAAGSLAFFMWISGGLSQPAERALFRGLAPEEAARVVDALTSENLDYRLDDGGTSIFVPAEQVHEARIRVASRGLPSGGGVGFELFDRPAFGVTDFVHRVNYRRAIQGELARSIQQFRAVDRARVQVVIPERKSVFDAANRRASASVVLSLKPGRDLNVAQVRGVVHLVASSIEGLDPETVVVVDDTGRLLTADEGQDPASAPAGALAHQMTLEGSLANRVETILEKTVGLGRVVARVRAELDWTRNEVTQERFDPDSQVARSETRDEETSTEAGPGGVPGIAANRPGAVAAAPAGNSQSSQRTSETINYEISKTVNHRIDPVGRVTRLSLAVLVADKQPEDPAAAPEPWDAASLEKFEEIARQAVGFDEERGDVITVTSAPFARPDIELEEEESAGFLTPELMILLANVLRVLAIVLGLFAFGKFVLQPMLGAVTAAGAALPRRAGELEAELTDGILPPSPVTLAERIGKAAGGERSEDGMKAIRSWLHQG